MKLCTLCGLIWLWDRLQCVAPKIWISENSRILRLCMYVSRQTSMNVCPTVCIPVLGMHESHTYMYVCSLACMRVCMCVCMYI